MQVNLNAGIDVAQIRAESLLDNRVLGMKAGDVLQAVYGGTVTGGGNRQINWSKDGLTYAVGTGNYPSCFIQSKYKGAGRKAPSPVEALKEGDAYIWLGLTACGNRIITKSYSKQEVVNSL